MQGITIRKGIIKVAIKELPALSDTEGDGELLIGSHSTCCNCK